MLQKLPKGTPCIQLILDDLERPKIKDVAKALGVSERTVYRWIEGKKPPRIACLALWWLTRWGQQEIDASLVDTNALFRQYVHVLIDENERLKAEINRVSGIAEFGSANDPSKLTRSEMQKNPGRPKLDRSKELEKPDAKRMIRPQTATTQPRSR